MIKKFLLKNTVCVSVLLAFSSCGSTDSSLDIENVSSSEFNSEYNINVINNDTVPYSKILDDELSDNDIIMAKVFEDFAIDKLDKYSLDEESNFVFSPFNASLTFSLMKNVANEKEQTEINEYLGLSNKYSIDRTNLYNRKAISNIQKDLDEKGNELNISNKIWVKKESYIYRSFLSILNSYNSNIEGVEFDNSSDRQTIDSYIQDNSNSNKASLSSEYENNMNSLFCNSIRFSMQWKDELYSCKDTINNGQIVTSREKIGRRGEFNYVDLGFYNITEIPYVDSNYSMYLIYTPFSDSRYLNVLSDIVAQGGIDECIQQMEYAYLDLKFPKFSIATTMSLIKDNKSYLKCYSKASPNNFILNSISQVCAIQVDENGTSAKNIINNGFDINDVTNTNAAPSSPQFIELDINGPFWFIIRNNKLKSILFAGCVKDI